MKWVKAAVSLMGVLVCIFSYSPFFLGNVTLRDNGVPELLFYGVILSVFLFMLLVIRVLLELWGSSS